MALPNCAERSAAAMPSSNRPIAHQRIGAGAMGISRSTSQSFDCAVIAATVADCG
ncbi:MAG: hypothetical protein JWL96_1318 [Sphingomonas bacterium]|nr:hypothetical protein [Sphingomonas bacterium]